MWAAGALIQAGLTPNEYLPTTSESAVSGPGSSSCGDSFCSRQQQANQIAPRSLGGRAGCHEMAAFLHREAKLPPLFEFSLHTKLNRSELSHLLTKPSCQTSKDPRFGEGAPRGAEGGGNGGPGPPSAAPSPACHPRRLPLNPRLSGTRPPPPTSPWPKQTQGPVPV